MKRKVKLTTRHGLHWTLDKGVRVALQALTHKARATFDGFAAGRKPGLPDTGQMSAEQIIENLRADFEDWGDEGIKRCPDWCASDAEQCPSCMARTALKGEDDA